MKLLVYWKHLTVLFAMGMLRYWLHRFEIIAVDFEAKLVATAFRWLFKRGNKMVPSETLPIGNVGSVKFNLSAGKVAVTETVSVDGGALTETATVQADAGIFIDQLQAAIAAKLPASAAPIESGVFAVLKAALLSIQ